MSLQPAVALVVAFSVAAAGCGDARTAAGAAPDSVRAVAVAAGTGHALALDDRGRVWSWGLNGNGELGQAGDEASFDARPAPGLVADLPGARSVYAVGQRSFAVDSSGGLWGWGKNTYDELGLAGGTADVGFGAEFGLATGIGTPVRVPVPEPVAAVAGGAAGHTYALAESGRVYSWGSDEGSGVLGRPAVAPGRGVYPVAPVEGLPGIAALGSGLSHGVAVDSSGGVWTWGSNERGALGRPGGRPREDGVVDLYGVVGESVPARLDRVGGVRSARGAFDTSAVLTAEGVVWTWGNNLYGQLGRTGGIGERLGGERDPARVGGLRGVASLSVGDDVVLAVDSSGTVWAWGADGDGQLGRGEGSVEYDLGYLSVTPRPVVGLPPAVAAAAGAGFAVAVDASGAVWAWGGNGSGQLGRVEAPAEVDPEWSEFRVRRETQAAYHAAYSATPVRVRLPAHPVSGGGR